MFTMFFKVHCTQLIIAILVIHVDDFREATWECWRRKLFWVLEIFWRFSKDLQNLKNAIETFFNENRLEHLNWKRSSPRVLKAFPQSKWRTVRPSRAAHREQHEECHWAPAIGRPLIIRFCLLRLIKFLSSFSTCKSLIAIPNFF